MRLLPKTAAGPSSNDAAPAPRLFHSHGRQLHGEGYGQEHASSDSAFEGSIGRKRVGEGWLPAKNAGRV